MTSSLIFLAAGLVLCCLVLLALAYAAPVGWQDEDGFHFGDQFETRDDRCIASRKLAPGMPMDVDSPNAGGAFPPSHGATND